MVNSDTEEIPVVSKNQNGIWISLILADLREEVLGANTVAKYSVLRVELKEKGVSTLKARNIWFDKTIKRLNTDGRGDFIKGI